MPLIKLIRRNKSPFRLPGGGWSLPGWKAHSTLGPLSVSTPLFTLCLAWLLVPALDSPLLQATAPQIPGPQNTFQAPQADTVWCDTDHLSHLPSSRSPSTLPSSHSGSHIPGHLLTVPALCLFTQGCLCPYTALPSIHLPSATGQSITAHQALLPPACCFLEIAPTTWFLQYFIITSILTFPLFSVFSFLCMFAYIMIIFPVESWYMYIIYFFFHPLSLCSLHILIPFSS